MPHRSAKDIEHHYFEQFRTHADLPVGQVIYDDKPDVQILGARRIGIEIARLYLKDGANPSSEQVQAARRLKVLALAQQIHRAKGGHAIELHVDFNPSHPVAELASAAEQLAEYALQIESKPGKVHGGGRESGTLFRFVYHDGRVYPKPKWRSAQVFTVPTLDVDRLEEVVTGKSSKAANYARCDAYWLLLVVDFADPAQEQELDLPPDYRLPSNPFERVVVYKPQFRQVVEVPR